MNPDSPFNRNDYSATQMIQDYENVGYRSDHYDDFNTEAEEMTQREIEKQMAEQPTASSEGLVLDEVALVHVSTTRVVIVDHDGGVTVLGRFNGDVKAV